MFTFIFARIFEHVLESLALASSLSVLGLEATCFRQLDLRTWPRGIGVGNGCRGAVHPPWIFKHGTNVVDRGLKVLFFGLLSVAPPPGKFSADALALRQSVIGNSVLGLGLGLF